MTCVTCFRGHRRPLSPNYKLRTSRSAANIVAIQYFGNHFLYSDIDEQCEAVVVSEYNNITAFNREEELARDEMPTLLWLVMTDEYHELRQARSPRLLNIMGKFAA